jgi:NADH-quinone oxidoreductase subunit C
MIRPIPGEELGGAVQVVFPQAVERWVGPDVWVKPEAVLDVCDLLRRAPGMEFDLLNSISAVDYVESFEIVYHMTSTVHRHSAVLRTRVFGRGEPAVPSVVSVWQGADLQEREIWDLMGVRFDGHPNLKRILLWEGFQGHPLRRDYLESPR